MDFDLVEHSDNPFSVNGTTYGVQENKTVIPNGPAKISYSVLMLTDDGWTQLDKIDLVDIKSEREYGEKYDRVDVAVEYIQDFVAENF